jgi:hypothetical protein
MCGIFRFRRAANFLDVACDPVEAVGRDVLLAARRHQLHADADAEERPRLVTHGFSHRLDHAVERVQPLRQSANAPTPGSTTRSARNTVRDHA